MNDKIDESLENVTQSISNRLKLESKDIVVENIEKIGELFPNVITETENGKKIDYDLLKQELSKDIVEGNKERYQLTWAGKKESIVTANTPINKTLRPVKEKSVDFDNTQNIYIEGDNLEALKILQNSYLNKIKCIYIDPPYNTGKDFIYKDNYKKALKEMEKEEGLIDSENNRLISNSYSNGRFHSDWLSMIYPRLKLSRNLLSNDGIIFISIDENEFSNMKKLCDEIFGEQNFIINFIWEKGKEGGNDSSIMRSHYENILCYCKNSSNDNIINLDKKDTSRHMSELPEENLIAGIIKEERKGELFQLINLSKQKDYTVKIALKDGKIIEWPSYAPQSTIDNWIKIGKVFVGTKKVPYIKSFLLDELQGQKPSNIITQKYGTTKSGSIEIRELFGSREIFSYPKPSTLIRRLLDIGSKKDSIVLDFFSGSATAAQAVLEKNVEDNGKRRFILVQIPENCEKNIEMQREGYKTICDLGEERIRRAAKKIKEETNADIDYGFRVYKVDSSNMKDVYYKPNDLKQEQLNMFESNIKEDRTSEDLLTQVILDLGLTLDLNIEEKNILENKVYFVDKNSLVACFDNNINIDILNEICEVKPLKIVFRESSFKNDSDKINCYERIKKLSKETEINVM